MLDVTADITTREPFTETDALAYLTEHPQQRSARGLAAIFGWHRSKVERLLNRVTTPPVTLPALPAPIADPEEVELDWFAPDNPDLVVHTQPAICVYQNPYGALVLRAESTHQMEEDQVVRIAPHLVRKVIDRMLVVLADIEAGQ